MEILHWILLGGMEDIRRKHIPVKEIQFLRRRHENHPPPPPNHPSGKAKTETENANSVGGREDGAMWKAG